MMQCTIDGGRIKGANERSFLFVHQHGGDDVTSKPPISATEVIKAHNVQS